MFLFSLFQSPIVMISQRHDTNLQECISKQTQIKSACSTLDFSSELQRVYLDHDFKS